MPKMKFRRRARADANEISRREMSSVIPKKLPDPKESATYDLTSITFHAET